MSGWIVAGALEQLRSQLDDLAPRRSRASDGAIGDAAHATRDSDHNPWVVIGGQAYVTARDFTHDPAGGLDCTRLSVALRTGRDPRVKYVIWNRAIMSGAEGPSPWVWRAYSGSNPHTKHLHLSVVADLRGTIRTPWALPGVQAAPPPSAPDVTARLPTVTPKDDAMNAEQNRLLVELYTQLVTGPDAGRWGWPAWDGGSRRADGTPDRFTVVDYLRKANQAAEDARRDVAALRAEIAARPAPGPVQIDYAALARELIAAAKGA